MYETILSKLTGVRRRQQWLFAARVSVFGLFASAALGTIYGLWKFLAAEPVSPVIGAAILAAGPLLGLIVGLVRYWSWQSAAAAVDRHYQLKDRTVTALEFAARSDGSPWHELQVRDATAHLHSVDPPRVVPFRTPQLLPYACGLLAVAVALLVWPVRPAALHAHPTGPLPQIVAVADMLNDDLQRLDEVAEEEENEELKELIQELLAKVEELKEPDVDVREALATLSEMQAAIAEQQAQYNDALVDAELQALGSAMMAAEAFQAAGQALQQGEFTKAADELEQLDDPQLNRRAAKAAAEELRKAAESMEKAGLGQMSGSASEIADGIQSGNSGKIKGASGRLARNVRQHNNRRRINRMLSLKLNQLNECKSLCQGGNCPHCQSSLCQGGQCQGEGNSLAEGDSPKSESPSQSWGKGRSNNIFGETTNLDSNRQQQEITGTPGDGPSEVETTTSPEGRQQAQRGYREAFEQYQKMSEAVLESEPIPLGHRQTIRRYFELIRPQNTDDYESAETN